MRVHDYFAYEECMLRPFSSVAMTVTNCHLISEEYQEEQCNLLFRMDRSS